MNERRDRSTQIIKKMSHYHFDHHKSRKDWMRLLSNLPSHDIELLGQKMSVTYLRVTGITRKNVRGPTINEWDFLLAVLVILQPANTDSLWPWSFLHPQLQWHGFAMPQRGVGAWHVRRCLWTSSWKQKHGTLRSDMPSFFVLNSVTLPPQHMENFSRPLEKMQRQEHEAFDGIKCFLKAETLLKMSSAAVDHQQHGQVTTQHG